MPFCGAWDIDDACSDLPPDTDQALIDRWQAVSSELLWAATGRRYGLCEIETRPCSKRCWGGNPYFGFIDGPSALPFPFLDGGTWRNITLCGCGGACSCTSLSEIVLDGPVAEIVAVDIGTDTLDPDQYRVDLVGSGYRLVRIDGSHWPACQDLQAACGEEGAFCVTYLQGLPLSDLAIAANTELTSELVKACLPNCKTCKLPANVTSVLRRGVTITFTPPALEWMRTLRMVAAFIDAVNPQGLTSASRVWSPDVPRTRTTLAPPVS